MTKNSLSKPAKQTAKKRNARLSRGVLQKCNNLQINKDVQMELFDETKEDLTITDVMSHVHRLVESCIEANDHQQKDRTEASEYFQGKMDDVVNHPDMSGAVSTDIRDTIKKLMPSVMRTLLANDRVAEYEPSTPDQVEAAKQATNYVNMVALRECDAEKAIYDAVYDAMVMKTGILKWCAYKTRQVDMQRYTNQPDEMLAILEQDPDVEIMDLTSRPSDDQELLMLNPGASVHDFQVKHVVSSVTPKLEAIRRESFLIDPRADGLKDAEIAGERLLLTRSDLIGMGYNHDEVFSLSSWDDTGDEVDSFSRRGDDWFDIHPISSKAMQVCEVFEVYVKLDLDGDGTAETHRIVYGVDGGSDAVQGSDDDYILLGHELVSEVPYTSVVVERDPHQFEGHSITEDLKRVQQMKTVLLRGLLDNTYAQSEPRTAYVAALLENPEDVASPRAPLSLVPGQRIDDAIQYRLEPFVGDKLLAVMEYTDTLIKEKTGITDASGGLTPEALQNQTATATTLISEAGFNQADSIVRSIANGLREAFEGLLRLIIAHADKPRTMLVNGEFVQYDPRTWDADMRCTIAIGLGGGTKERDLASLQIVLNMQKEVIAAFGPDNPYVKPEQLYNTMQKITETTGLPSADPFFTQPDPQEVAMKLAQAANKPDPDMVKLEAQMALEKQKAQAQVQREQAQLEADMMVKEQEAARDEESEIRKHMRELEKLRAQTELKMAEIEANMIVKGITQTPPDIIPGGLSGKKRASND